MVRLIHSWPMNLHAGFIALLTTFFYVGCTGTQESAPTAGNNTMHAIILAAPSDAERSALRAGTKGEPFQVGFGRDVPTAQRRVMLSKLPWRAAATGYIATVSMQSTGARSLRVGLRLNQNVPDLECSFRGSTATLRGDAIVSTGSDVYWSPVLAGDTAWIELTVRTRPKDDAILEVPAVSHIP